MKARNTLIALAVSFCAMLLVPSDASAGASVSGKVVSVRVDYSGLGMIFFDKPIAPTGCGQVATYKNALAIDTRQPGGRSALAAALAAKATGATVSAFGLGTCAIYGTTIVEDFNYATVY